MPDKHAQAEGFFLAGRLPEWAAEVEDWCAQVNASEAVRLRVREFVALNGEEIRPAAERLVKLLTWMLNQPPTP
jgi:hypothetical protein